MLLAFYNIFTHDAPYQKILSPLVKTWERESDIRVLKKAPFTKYTENNLIYWDAAHYRMIRDHGYDEQVARGDANYAFFPMFPFVWRYLGLNNKGIIIFNFILFGIALSILIRLFIPREKIANYQLLLFAFPSIIIFLIPYTEAFFFLFVTVGIYGVFRKKYWIYFLGFFLASMTRPSFTILMLSVILVEAFFLIQDSFSKKQLGQVFGRVIPFLVGTCAVSLIQLSQGSGKFFKFIDSQKYWSNEFGRPRALVDWSHEGFSINQTIIFLLMPVLLLFVFRLAKTLFKSGTSIFSRQNPKEYLLLLSVAYLVGNMLFVLLFRGGSLHCLFRFTMCNPFFYILVFLSLDYLKKWDLKDRTNIFFVLGFVSLLLMFMTEYTVPMNFSDMGFVLFIGLCVLVLFKNQLSNLLYYFLLIPLIILNIIWTSFLFDAYISDGWIFA